MKTVTATEARLHFGEVTRRVETEGEEIVVQKAGRDIAAIIPIHEYRRYREFRERDGEWYQRVLETHRMIQAQHGDAEITPAIEIVRQMREDRDADLADLY